MPHLPRTHRSPPPTYRTPFAHLRTPTRLPPARAPPCATYYCHYHWFCLQKRFSTTCRAGLLEDDMQIVGYTYAHWPGYPTTHTRSWTHTCMPLSFPAPLHYHTPLTTHTHTYTHILLPATFSHLSTYHLPTPSCAVGGGMIWHSHACTL